MSRILILACLLLITPTLIGSMVWMQSEGRSNWSGLVGRSSIVVVGTIEEQLLVIRPDRMTSTLTNNSNGRVIAELPNPSDYVVGRVYRLRVDEVVKRGEGVNEGGTVDVFVSGRPSTHDPAFTAGQKFLVFLSSLQTINEEFAGTMTVRPTSASEEGRQFDPRLSYVVVLGDTGVMRINSENHRLVDEVREAVHSSSSNSNGRGIERDQD